MRLLYFSLVKVNIIINGASKKKFLFDQQKTFSRRTVTSQKIMVVDNILQLTLICHVNHFKVFYWKGGKKKILSWPQSLLSD